VSSRGTAFVPKQSPPSMGEGLLDGRRSPTEPSRLRSETSAIERALEIASLRY